MLLLGVFLILVPALSFGNYGWGRYSYGASYGGYGYGYGNQPYSGSYFQPQPYDFTSNMGGFSHGFRNFLYPIYYYLPSKLLKSGAYGALKGAGTGAAIGGIMGLIG
ncbi:hypothetical protein LOAG_00365 [Loa loa]|uniref:Uncharacterized protein n=1 Tax=Loa loa TaxID=7209 RepID=A0A1S0UBY8_LOALO|nr:hypothetical protein LOAG_00365 [Loa loa]EFO28106.1 hypothetical protein LOAG_00365 [Loa loa]